MAMTVGPGSPGAAGTPPERAVHPREGLAGREREVFRLGAAWGAATRGRAAIVMLAGPAGVGKSRLADEAVRLARSTGGMAVRVHCDTSFPRPLADALREALGRRAAAAEGAEPAGPAEGAEPAGPAGPVALDEIAGLLHGLADRGPALLVLDGVHRAGTPAVELLRLLTPRLAGDAGTALLVVATLRAPEGDAALHALADVATRIDVRPLPPAATGH